MASQTISRDERLGVIKNILFRSPEGVRVVTLAEACQVDRRTIYRDMSKLREGGVPLYQQGGRYFVSREYYLGNVQLNVYEAIALFTATRVMTQLAEQKNPHAVSAMVKLCAALPQPLAQHVEAVAVRLREYPMDRLFVRVVESLIRAWGECRWVKLWTSESAATIQLAPYFLDMNAHGVVYVVGVDGQQKVMRAINTRSVVRIELLGQTFQRMEHFQPEAYLTDQSGVAMDDMPQSIQVVVACEPDLARLIMGRGLHALKRSVNADDGRVHLYLQVMRWEDLMAWLWSWGAEVEVISPVSMRQAIREELEQILALYR